MFRKNVLGDVTHIYKLNNGALALAAKYKYDAWGKCTVENIGSETIGDINPIRYRGYYYDTETGLYYLNARYYDPETGRFISADSTQYLEPNTINGLNLYAYCGNNPVMLVDGLGNSFKSWFMDKIGNPVKNFFTNTVPTWFMDKIGNPTKEFFTNTLPTWFMENWKGVLDAVALAFSVVSVLSAIVGMVFAPYAAPARVKIILAGGDAFAAVWGSGSFFNWW